MEQIKMNTIFNQVWKFVAGGATVLAYGAWIERIKKSNNIIEYKNEINYNINSVQHQLNNLEHQLSSNLDIEIRKQIMQKVKELSFDLNNLKAIHNNYISKFENGNINSNPESSLNIYNQYKEQIDNTFKKANSKANEISDILNNTKNKFMGDNNISKIISDFNEYLATLSNTELCLIINITSCVFIFTCIVTILLSILGNYLIDKFSLENRFPKLAKLIQLRHKFQNYYIVLNSVLIIIAIIPLILVNFITLTL
jgi:hypothetical protein